MITIESNSIKIPVLEAGQGRILVDKPAGISVHNRPGEDLCSLIVEYIQTDTGFRQKTNFDPDFGVNPVHRLDKETSGIILLAVTRDMFRFYAQQFDTREVKKGYVVILHGLLENLQADGTGGTWKWPLSKKAGGRHNPVGPGKRLSCETRYRVMEHSVHYTMLAVELHSGRTHQIRRHAKLAGHPVVGDARYGSARAINYLKENLQFERLALHARSLTLRLEPGNNPKTIEISRIPDSMTMLFGNDKISIEPVDPRQSLISKMISDLDEYQASLYPPESNHLVEVEKLAGADYLFLAALDQQHPLAIASFKRVSEQYVEIKRLYVPTEHRGRKLAIRLMQALEKRAVSEGYAEARLETGVHQYEAISLYEKLGYEKTGPFGSYEPDPVSVFMRKKL